MINNKEVIKSGRSVTLARCKAMSRRTKISGKRPLCEVSVFVAYTVENQQALLQRQAESAAVVQRLYTGVRREPYEPSAAKQWQNLKYWVSRFGDGRLNPNSLSSQPNRT